LLSAPLAQAQSAGGGYTVPQSVVAGGGGQNSTGGAYSLDGTIGQAAAGTAMSGGDYLQAGGFWMFDFGSVPPPTPVIIAAGLTLVNESCPPANGAIDPGERVSVNLALTNSSYVGTSNLVATLLSSANVIAPDGPQSYGAIAPTATVSRTFSFTAAGVSGQTSTLTLQLQDGETNLGTATYTATLGANTSCTQARVVVTGNTLTRSDSNVVVNITVQNQGVTTANALTLTSATLGVTSGTPLPQDLGNLAPGQTATATITFANPGAAGSRQVLRLRGTFDGGSAFSKSQTMTLP
jgi:hypothetical protein